MITFGYEGTDWRLTDETEHARWIRLVLSQHGQRDGEVTYVFCDDAYILYLNKTYLDHDYYTDILTFNYTPEGSEEGLVADLFISIDTVRSNAEAFGTSFIDELHRVMAHGALHLSGHDDHTEKQKKEMRHQEEVALNLRMF